MQTLIINPQTKTLDESPYLLISLAGHFDDENLSHFENTVEPLLQSNHTYLIFDLGKLEFLNSRAIGYFDNIYNRSKGVNKRIAFLNDNDVIDEILEMMGLSEIIPTFEAEEKLLAAMRREEI